MFNDNMPQQFGTYRLLEKIGQGGMAEIFRAESYGSQGFVKEVAIKRILSSLASNEDFITQFLDEARIAGSLSHPNIVQIYDVGQVDDAYYIAMEFVNGKHLGQVIRRAVESMRMFPFHVAVLVVKEVAQALAFAHSARDSLGNPLQIIHRDISPQNILVDYHGAIKLTDFGIAKAANKLFQTTAGVIKGKFSYLAPEQLVGHSASPGSDLFSLGVVMWELLSGRRLFQGESDIKTIQLVQACEIPPLQQFRNDIPEDLDEILRNLLSANPEYRYQDAYTLVRDLSYFLTGKGISEGPSQVADFMGSLYPESFPSTKGSPETQAMPAVSLDELEAYAKGKSANQSELDSFEDAMTPVASIEELTNPNQAAWSDAPPTASNRPTQAGDFDDIATSAIDMSPLLNPNAFDNRSPNAFGDNPTNALDESPLRKMPAPPSDIVEETSVLPVDDVSDDSISDRETVPPTQEHPNKAVARGASQGNSKKFVYLVLLLFVICAGVWGTFFILQQSKQPPPPRIAAQPSGSPTLEVEIDPPNARVTLNGVVMDGDSNLRTQKNLVGGLKYRVQASLKGYIPKRQEVVLVGNISRIRIKLEPQK